MLVVGDNTNTVSSITISNNPKWLQGPFTNPLFPNTDGESPVSNAIVESYMNVIFPCRIEKVIFNDPATIVIWKDKSKTVVKCHNEDFDREKGLAMCIAKKLFGGKYRSTFREWCEE